MPEFARDQAEGLRRLLARDFVRVITIASGREGIGKTSLVLNLAVALARRGRNVLLLDEHAGAGNIESQLGLRVRHELLDLMRRQRTLDEVIVPASEGVDLLPAAKGVRQLGCLTALEQEGLMDSFQSLPRSPDVVLVDAMAGIRDNTLSFSVAAQEVLIVVSPEAASITDAYALIKVLSRDFARTRFHLVVQKAKSPEDAANIYNNMKDAAVRYLGVVLNYLGHVPYDEKLRQSRKLQRPVVDAFPSAPSAATCRQLAESIDQWPYPTEHNQRLDSFIQRLIINSRMAAEGLRL
jgi:flagellar biosynthesis protein FlhG